MKQLIILILTLAVVHAAAAQQNRPIREKIEAQKVAFITKELNLTIQESQRFWPIYNEYWDRMENLREMDFGMRKDKELSDEKAKEMINRFLEREENELKLKKQLYIDLKGVLPATKIVRLHQAEMQFKQKLLEHLKNRRERN